MDIHNHEYVSSCPFCKEVYNLTIQSMDSPVTISCAKCDITVYFYCKSHNEALALWNNQQETEE